MILPSASRRLRSALLFVWAVAPRLVFEHFQARGGRVCQTTVGGCRGLAWGDASHMWGVWRLLAGLWISWERGRVVALHRWQVSEGLCHIWGVVLFLAVCVLFVASYTLV